MRQLEQEYSEHAEGESDLKLLEYTREVTIYRSIASYNEKWGMNGTS